MSLQGHPATVTDVELPPAQPADAFFDNSLFDDIIPEALSEKRLTIPSHNLQSLLRLKRRNHKPRFKHLFLGQMTEDLDLDDDNEPDDEGDAGNADPADDIDLSPECIDRTHQQRTRACRRKEDGEEKDETPLGEKMKTT